MKPLLFLAPLVLAVACTKHSEPPAPATPAVADSTADATAPAASGGATFSVRGVVKFAGKVPKDTLKMNADKVCANAHGGKPVPQTTILADDKGGLANVFISVKEVPGGSFPPPGEPVVLDQKGCLYVPQVVGVRVGQTLSILNSDPTMHNVNAQSKKTQGFNVGMANAGQKIDKTFTKPEQMIRVKCDVHGWMNAHVGVMEHPFFAVSNGAGSFELPPLPPGTYTLEAWHEKLGTQTASVTLANQNEQVTFTFQ